MIEQVRVERDTDRYADTIVDDKRASSRSARCRAPPTIEHSVTSAVAPTGNVRIVIDELLVGNALEEIACRASVADGRVRQRCRSARRPTTSRSARSRRTCSRPTCNGRPRGLHLPAHGGCIVGRDRSRRASRSACSTSTRTARPTTSASSRRGRHQVRLDRRSRSTSPTSYWNPSGDQQPPAHGWLRGARPGDRASPRRAACRRTTSAACRSARRRRQAGHPGLRAGERRRHAGCTPGDVGAFKFKTNRDALRRRRRSRTRERRQRTQPLIFGANAPIAGDLAHRVTSRRRAVPRASRVRHHADVEPASTSRLRPLSGDDDVRITITTAADRLLGQALPQPRHLHVHHGRVRKSAMNDT